jgi:hypothetical protein
MLNRMHLIRNKEDISRIFDFPVLQKENKYTILKICQEYRNLRKLKNRNVSTFHKNNSSVRKKRLTFFLMKGSLQT